jgi:hypothetical protein
MGFYKRPIRARKKKTRPAADRVDPIFNPAD